MCIRDSDCFNDKKKTKKDQNGNVVRSGYANGSYSEQEVSFETNWGPNEIQERGLKLLSFMESRWKINLGNNDQKKDLLHLVEKDKILE